ncbi:unnamed protein product [Polarella glacialis]|uniref:EF-hand domain-containing protein n=1 Tax=Polarella glacialis TaxID=89957 RepID=A0A813LSW9_POLGL|nr:unnamed protein product [Polarella glacialis]
MAHLRGSADHVKQPSSVAGILNQGTDSRAFPSLTSALDSRALNIPTFPTEHAATFTSGFTSSTSKFSPTIANIHATLEQRLSSNTNGRNHLRRQHLQQQQKQHQKFQKKQHRQLESREPSAPPTISSSNLSLLRHRPGSSSLPSLQHWCNTPAAEPSSPYVPPPCPHESPLKATKKPKWRAKTMDRSDSAPQLSEPMGFPALNLDDFILSETLPQDEESFEIGEEAFVDDCLERMYPGSPTAPTSPTFLKWNHLPDVRVPSRCFSRTASLNVGKGGIVGSSNEGWGAQSFRHKMLERFCTTRHAFELFLHDTGKSRNSGKHKLTEADWELPVTDFVDFFGKHFPEIPEEDYGSIFSFLDQDGNGTISIPEFYRVVEAMSPVKTLEALRGRWIALGYPSTCQMLEQVAPRSTWGTRRLTPQQFGTLLSKVGVLEWEEQLYIFEAVSKPNFAGTVSVSELFAAMTTVSPVLFIEDLDSRFMELFDNLERAYDRIDCHPGAVCDLNKFVMKAREHLRMNPHEAKRFFRLCDFDQRGRINRSRFLGIFEMCKMNLRFEALRTKVRQFFQSTLLDCMLSLSTFVDEDGKAADTTKGTLDFFAPDILMAFKRRSSSHLKEVERTPDEFQHTLDELELTPEDCADLFKLVDLTGKGDPTPRAFIHNLSIFAPGCVLDDLALRCSRIAAATVAARQAALKLPAWQARQRGHSQFMSPELQRWVDKASAAAKPPRNTPNTPCASTANKAESAALAPAAVLSSAYRPSSSDAQQRGRHDQEFEHPRQTKLNEASLEQALHASGITTAEAPPFRILDLLAEPVLEVKSATTRIEHEPTISLAELAVAIGSTSTSGSPTVLPPAGREAKAQLEARWQLAPFCHYASDLRETVRVPIKKPEMSRDVPTGNAFLPDSYVAVSSPPQAPRDMASSFTKKKANADGAEEETKKANPKRAPLAGTAGASFKVLCGTRPLTPLSSIHNVELRRLVKADWHEQKKKGEELPQVFKRGPASEWDSWSVFTHVKDASFYKADKDMMERLHSYVEESRIRLRDDKTLLKRCPYKRH